MKKRDVIDKIDISLSIFVGDASDLSLSFTVANDDFGNNKEIELIPNGRNIDVTNYNKERYISKFD